MNSKTKFFSFLIVFLLLIGSASYLAYNFFKMNNKSDENDEGTDETTEKIVYEEPDYNLKGDILEIKDQGIVVLNRSNDKEEQYYFTDDTECIIIDAENDNEEDCDYESLVENMDQYIGIGSKLIISSNTSNIKTIQIFISDI